ncbi:hypothetical protein [Spirosoma gilvum]
MDLLANRWWLVGVIAGCLLLTSAKAQQGHVPGVTDITSVTTLSNLNPTEFRRFVQKGCRDSSQFAMERHQQVGHVSYRGELQAYVISYGEPNTFDTVRTGLICNLANARQWLGKTVTFSGRYFHARGLVPQHAGEHIYYLYVTVIRGGT